MKKKESGFTLLEVMITMMIVAVGLLATAQLLITVMKQNSSNEMRVDSSAAVHAMLSEASTRVKDDATCNNLAANNAAKARGYLGVNYAETVNCARLGASTEQRYRIYAEVKNRAGKKIASSSTVITTVTPAN